MFLGSFYQVLFHMIRVYICTYGLVLCKVKRLEGLNTARIKSIKFRHRSSEIQFLSLSERNTFLRAVLIQASFENKRKPLRPLQRCFRADPTCASVAVRVSEEIKQSSDVSQHFNQKSRWSHKDIMNSFEQAKHNMHAMSSPAKQLECVQCEKCQLTKPSPIFPVEESVCNAVHLASNEE